MKGSSLGPSRLEVCLPPPWPIRPRLCPDLFRSGSPGSPEASQSSPSTSSPPSRRELAHRPSCFVWTCARSQHEEDSRAPGRLGMQPSSASSRRARQVPCLPRPGWPRRLPTYCRSLTSRRYSSVRAGHLPAEFPAQPSSWAPRSGSAYTQGTALRVRVASNSTRDSSFPAGTGLPRFFIRSGCFQRQ